MRLVWFYTSTSSVSELKYVEIKYNWSSNWSIYISSSSPTIHYSTINWSANSWIYIYSWIPTISYNIINWNVDYWIELRGDTSAEINNNTIENNWVWW